MPPALQGSASTGASKNTGSSARSEPASGGSSRQDFDALLKGDADTAAPAPARPAGKPGKAEATATPGSEPDPGTDTAKRPAADDGSEASSDAATASTPAGKPGTADAADETEPAPWPPFGLAGLALAGAVPAVPAPMPATPVPVSDADPLLAPATATPALPLAAVGTAAAGAPAAAEPGAIALPAGTEAPAPADDAPMLKVVTEALASSDGGEAPATPLLHALHAASELKSSAVTAAFTGSPTATPDVGADDFGDAMSARIGWLADQKIGHAVIRVTPHDLGQIEVRLQIDGDKVHASFSSAHAEVRHALESNMPRLREMLGEQGFQLGNADVGQQHTAQDGKPGSGQAGTAGGDGEPALTEVTVSPAQLMRQRGLVDAYA